ncbi:hypothetical protein Tco_0096758 [Tanacetum coccineum]
MYNDNNITNPDRARYWGGEITELQQLTEGETTVLKLAIKAMKIVQTEVIIPFGDIDEIRRSQHAVINPAVTIVLRMGAGAPPLRSPDGQNHAIRTLQRAAKNYHSMIEAEKKEQQHSELRASSSSLKHKKQAKVLEESVPKKDQKFVQEDVLTGISILGQTQNTGNPKQKDGFLCTTEQFFDMLLSDGSSFTSDYRSIRKDTNLNHNEYVKSEPEERRGMSDKGLTCPISYSEGQEPIPGIVDPKRKPL